MKKILVCLFVSFAIITFSNAQSVRDSLTFRKPLLFEEFLSGTVLMRSGAIESAQLNYNTDDQAIVFIKDGQYMTLIGTDLIDTVFIQNKKFVPIKNAFYEVISNGNISLFVSYFNKTHPVTATVTHEGNLRKDNSQVSNTVSDVYISRSFKGNYDVQIFKIYFIKKAGKLFEFKSPKQFVKPFSSEMKASVLEYIESNHLNFNSNTDLIALVNFCNSKIKE